MVGMGDLVLFVCEHGANKSRLAAALFNRVAPAGWRAVSAGLQPQPAVSVHAVRLIAGTGAESLLDLEPPRGLDTVPNPARAVSIDCAAPGGSRWDLGCQEVGPAMVAELRDRTERLAAQLADEHR